ncbi:MAG: hypothetical protein QXE05_08940 [Nitrososphaeria archaeon]
MSSSYRPSMLSHQTGLSVTASTAGTFYAIGSAISVPRNGIAVISMAGHVSGSYGYIQLKLTRGSNTFTFGGSDSLFNNGSVSYIGATSSTPLTTDYNTYYNNLPLILPVYGGDSLQFYASNSGLNDITYIDDLLVMLI